MNTYIVTLDAIDLSDGLMAAKQKVVEHEGTVAIRDGALTFSSEVFEGPYIGYAPGAWLRFERKEA